MTTIALKVEIAFDSGFSTPADERTWTDVSAYVYGDVTINWGRGDQFATVEASTFSVRLNNTDGRFTAGNAASPYYPNVRLDRPIRVTAIPEGGSESVRATGYVDAWPVEWPSGVDSSAIATVPATSRTGRLALRNALRSGIAENAFDLGAEGVWALDDADGSTLAVAEDGSVAGPLVTGGAGVPLKFTGSGVEFAGGQYLGSGPHVEAPDPATFAGSFILTAPLALTDPRPEVEPWSIGALFGIVAFQSEADALVDGKPHRFVTTISGGEVVTYWDGVAGTPTIIDDAAATFTATAGVGFFGTQWDLVYDDAAWDASEVAADFAAFNGGVGETTEDRFRIYASYAGVPADEVVCDPGSCLMGPTDVAGMAVLDALRVVESTEGGIAYDDRDGTLRLQGRRVRRFKTVDATYSMTAEEIGADYTPVLDRSNLHNYVTGTNAATSIGQIDGGGTVTATAQDRDSRDEYGTRGSSVEVNAANPAEAYSAASWRVENFSEPSPRVPKLTIDLLPLDLTRTEETLALGISSRISVENQPDQAPASSMDFFIEGGTETYSAGGASVSFNVSPIGLNDSVVVIDDPVLGLIGAGNRIGY